MKTLLFPIFVLLGAAPAAAQRPSAPPPAKPPTLMHADSFGYVRIGVGRVLGQGGATDRLIGFGGRARMDRFAVDASILNFSPSLRGVGAAPGATPVSLIKVEALCFLGPTARTSVYVGGGVSWGSVSGYEAKGSSPASSASPSDWNGSGLQGELTAGYELPHAGRLRVFVQTDATLPFYHTIGESYASSNGRTAVVATARRYNPSIALSVGVGWHRRGR